MAQTEGTPQEDDIPYESATELAGGSTSFMSTNPNSQAASVAGVALDQYDAPVWWDDIQGSLIDYSTPSQDSTFNTAARQDNPMMPLREDWAVSGLNQPHMADPYGNTFDSKAFNPGAPRAQASSVGDAIYSYYRTTDDRRAFFQQLLYATGSFGLEPPESGRWGDPFDKDYGNAWERAVLGAQATGVPIMRMLRDMAKAFDPATRGSGPSGPKRPTVQVISDSDAKDLLDQVGQRDMGRALTADEEKVAKAMIAAIQSRQASEQNSLIDKQMAGGGQGVAPTSVQNIAAEELESNFGAETGAHSLASSFVDFIRLAGG